MHATVYMGRSEDNLWEWLLPTVRVLGIKLKVSRLGSVCFCWLNNLTSLVLCFFFLDIIYSLDL